MSYEQRKILTEFLKFARKVQKRDHWNIGGFLAEVEEEWGREQMRESLRRSGWTTR